MGRIYEAIDSEIMRGVNQGVRAWNYVTGRTKADLANIVNVGGLILFSMGMYHINKTLGAVFTPLNIFGGILTTSVNNQQETREIKALERGLKDVWVERKKENHKIYGPINLVCSLLALPGALSGRETSIEIGAGCFLTGTEDYIMRAENYPKRKNIVSRALDDLRETIGQYQLQRQPIPVRACYQETN